MEKILIVEDEPKVATSLMKGLEANGYYADIAYDGEKGLKMAFAKAYDILILDVNLPIINGLEVCRKVRQENTKIPILMLTALGTTADKVSGFNLGADDYLVKPFEFEELLARIKSLLKRSKIQTPVTKKLSIANLEMDLESKTVVRDGKKITLTAKEFFLLEYLLINKGRVVSRADIAEKIWDISFDTGTNVIDLYIFYLRKKIDKDFSPKLIHTHTGLGYVLKVED